MPHFPIFGIEIPTILKDLENFHCLCCRLSPVFAFLVFALKFPPLPFLIHSLSWTLSYTRHCAEQNEGERRGILILSSDRDCYVVLVFAKDLFNDTIFSVRYSRFLDSFFFLPFFSHFEYLSAHNSYSAFYLFDRCIRVLF